MESNGSSARGATLVDLLRNKDEGFKLPADWAAVKARKNEYFLALEEESAYEHRATA